MIGYTNLNNKNRRTDKQTEIAMERDKEDGQNAQCNSLKKSVYTKFNETIFSFLQFIGKFKNREISKKKIV